MQIEKPFKAKELRKLNEKELLEMMSNLDRVIMRFKAGQMMQGSQGSGGMINLPSSKGGRGVNWGLFGVLKANKARILTVLTERKSRSKIYGG
jgi:ribosomal protein L29